MKGVTGAGRQLLPTFDVRYRVDAAQVTHICADCAKASEEI